MKKKAIDFEINFFEGVISGAPHFFEALSALGDLYTRKGLYEKGLDVDLKLAQMRPDDPIVLYNLSCSYSLINDVDHGIASIKKAFECGYDDFEHLERDRDFKNLRMDARFVPLINSAKKKKGQGFSH